MFNPTPKITIEFAKSEYSKSPVDSETLRMVCSLYGPKIKDQLLIHKVDDA